MQEHNIKTIDTKKIFAISVAHFTNDFYANLIAPISFLFAIKLGLNLTQQGLIAIVILIFANLFQPLFGLYADKNGKSKTLIFSIIWITVWTSVAGLINNYYLLLIVLAIGSLASALFHPLGATTAISLGEKAKGTSLSIFMTIGGFAGSISPVVGLWIANSFGLSKLTYLIIPGLMVAWYMYFSKVQEIDIFAKKNKEAVKKKVVFTKTKIFWLIVLLFIAVVKSLIGIFMLTYGIQILTLRNVAIAALVLSLHLFVRPFGTILGGMMIDKIDDRKVFVLGMLMTLACILLIVFGNNIIASLGFVMIGFSLFSTGTVTVLMSHNIFPNGQSFATGIIMGVPGALGSLSMLIFSSIADINGLIFSSKLLIIPLVIATLLTIVIPYKFDN